MGTGRGGAALDIRVLGPIEAMRGGIPVELGGPIARRLLAALVVHRGHVASVDALCEVLWGDGQPPTAARSLQSHIARLRRSLGPGAEIAAQAPGYVLR